MKKKNSENRLAKKSVQLLIPLALGALLFGYLFQSVGIELNKKEMHALYLQKKQLLSETAMLQAEVDRLSNVDRIARIAREKYGLVFNNGPSVVVKMEQGQELQKLKNSFAQKDMPKPKIKTAGVVSNE